jgi:hypothetical protein
VSATHVGDTADPYTGTVAEEAQPAVGTGQAFGL